MSRGPGVHSPAMRSRWLSWVTRPAPHLGAELFARFRDLRALGLADVPADVLAREPHRVWRHAPAFDRDALMHVLPLERGLVVGWARVVHLVARWWLRRRGLERLGILECRRASWRWLVGDFHAELVDLLSTARLLQEGERTQHARELAAVRMEARREVLQDLEAGVRAGAGIPGAGRVQ